MTRLLGPFRPLRARPVEPLAMCGIAKAVPAMFVPSLAVLAMCLAACAGPAGTTDVRQPAAVMMPAPPAPILRLPPAALQRELMLQQTIAADFMRAGKPEHRELQVLLEANATHTRVAAIGGGQVLARLDWDGTELRITRSPWAPDSVQPERILSDLQLSLWPAPAIRGALPQGWALDDAPTGRRLRQGDDVVVEIRYPDAATTLIEQRRDGYRLTIRTLSGNSGANQ
ncbi:uncharacterized protein DUF3261 [Cupriavidus plantarum]|nr:uncharacterized protein DUF3261 [Cupriavidus plantarum]